MKFLFAILITWSGFTAAANDERCKINLSEWDEKPNLIEIFKLILADKGYDPVFDNSADLRLDVQMAGFAEIGCNDGSFYGDKNFKRTNAYVQIIYKNKRIIDSIYGSDIQTESTKFNNPENIRTACANYNSAFVSALYKIPHCIFIKDMLKEK